MGLASYTSPVAAPSAKIVRRQEIRRQPKQAIPCRLYGLGLHMLATLHVTRTVKDPSESQSWQNLCSSGPSRV